MRAARRSPGAVRRSSAGLYAPEMHDPELLIRTGGDRRLSNYLLWQLADAELVFSEELWPDFSRASFEAAIEEFKRRKRPGEVGKSSGPRVVCDGSQRPPRGEGTEGRRDWIDPIPQAGQGGPTPAGGPTNKNRHGPQSQDTKRLVCGPLLAQSLGLVEPEVGQQREQHQLRAQLGEPVEAADPHVVSDQTDHARDQRLVCRRREPGLDRGVYSNEPG